MFESHDPHLSVWALYELWIKRTSCTALCAHTHRAHHSHQQLVPPPQDCGGGKGCIPGVSWVSVCWWLMGSLPDRHHQKTTDIEHTAQLLLPTTHQSTLTGSVYHNLIKIWPFTKIKTQYNWNLSMQGCKGWKSVKEQFKVLHWKVSVGCVCVSHQADRVCVVQPSCFYRFCHRSSLVSMCPSKTPMTPSHQNYTADKHRSEVIHVYINK